MPSPSRHRYFSHVQHLAEAGTRWSRVSFVLWTNETKLTTIKDTAYSVYRCGLWSQALVNNRCETYARMFLSFENKIENCCRLAFRISTTCEQTTTSSGTLTNWNETKQNKERKKLSRLTFRWQWLWSGKIQSFADNRYVRVFLVRSSWKKPPKSIPFDFKWSNKKMKTERKEKFKTIFLLYFCVFQPFSLSLSRSFTPSLSMSQSQTQLVTR